jgi:hypothetical protein
MGRTTTGADNLPTEEEINEWTRRSLKDGFAVSFTVLTKPKKCKKCKNYYCSEHFPQHLDSTFEYSS